MMRFASLAPIIRTPKIWAMTSDSLFYSRTITTELNLATRTRSERLVNQERYLRGLSTTAAKNRSKDKNSDDAPGTKVGIFMDMDNVRPELLDRKSIRRDILDPLRQFVKGIDGDVTAFRAFGNRSTTTHETDEERNREFDQVFDMEHSTTGHDADGLLRCGVCGAKMKLTKKEKARGMDEFDKLNKHMRMLHDREQSKRYNRPRKKKMSAKDVAKTIKYKEAQVGLRRRASTSGGGSGTFRNALFRVLRAENVKCYEVANVDDTLIRHASKWMKKNPPGSVFIVVSKDADFLPLLQQAKAKKMYAVSAATDSGSQTKKLLLSSDIVLRKSNGCKEDTERVQLADTLVVVPFTTQGTNLVLEHIDKFLPTSCQADDAISALD